MLSKAPEEILVIVWLYLLHCPDGLWVCELVCHAWRDLMKRTFWDVACKQCMVSSEQQAAYSSKKLAFFANVHHFHWRRAVWGDISNSSLVFEVPDYLLYDAFPNVSQLYEDTLVTYTTKTVTGVDVKRERFLLGMLPSKEVEQLGFAKKQAEHCKMSSKFRTKTEAIKADMYHGDAVVLTTESIEVFEAPEGDITEASPYQPCKGVLDTEGIPSKNVAVIHLCRGVAYALLKKPVVVQMWDTTTNKKLGSIPLPGVYSWPTDDDFFTWKSQERFAFTDPSWYGVVIDDDGMAWVVNMDGLQCARIPTEDPARKVCFNSPHHDSYGVPANMPFPNPSASTAPVSIFSSPTDIHPSLSEPWGKNPSYASIPDPSLEESEDTSLVPATVRVCGPSVLLWGGKNHLDSSDYGYEEDVSGRAFIQLWRAESSYNLNSNSKDLVCVLQAKYDHLLIAHTDGHRVYVLFHPFFNCDAAVNQSQHIQHLAVDVWDANGGGFVCRRLVHDEDRSPYPFIQHDDLTPSLIQIVHGGPEELVYYISQKKNDVNLLTLHQLTTLASAKEGAALTEKTAEANGWWSEMDPEHPGVEKYWDLNLLVGSIVDSKVGTCLGKYGGQSLFFTEGHNGSLRMEVREKRAGDDEVCTPPSQCGSALELIAMLFGKEGLLGNVLHLPPLRPDFGSLSTAPTDCPAAFLNSVGPVISTQLACYQPSKASLVQSSITTLVHHLTYLDAIVQKVFEVHSGSWGDYVTDDGMPEPAKGQLLRALLRDAYLSIATGMIGCTLKDFYINTPMPLPSV